jgi:hypothetical protein
MKYDALGEEGTGNFIICAKAYTDYDFITS